ncbi:PKD domain-containing protein [Microscilla marina]|uniref:PKD domain protein n=1 Tax=Microscilla marina ATCC 23134 TaxID=313606 RepID=A1ZRW7_MICM2|nr:PKD domain-containing protein [Microscilla marina]EAY26855.1 PKD domain protein [Microscilla marina ATCC 23134]
MLMNYAKKEATFNRWRGKAAVLSPSKILFFTVCFFLLTDLSWADWSFKETLRQQATFSNVTLRPNANVCQGAPVTLGNIVIDEDTGENGDFNTGGSAKTLVLEFGANITFPATNSLEIKLDGSPSSDVTASVDGSNKLTIGYNFGPPTTTAQNNSITISNLQVEVANSVAAGSYELKVNASEGTGTAGELDLDAASEVFATITVKETPAEPSTIYGPLSLFQGETAVYSTPIVAGVDSYEWTLPAQLTLEAGSNLDDPFIVVTANGAISSANISVVAKKGSCSSSSLTKQVSISTKGVAVSGETTTLCDNQQLINLPDIVLSEKFYADFSAISGTLRLGFDNNNDFDFDVDNSEAIFTTASGVGQKTFDVQQTGSNTLEVNYNFVGSETELNSLIIRGVKVKATTASGSGQIRMKLGSANFEGISNATPLAKLAIGASPVAISFDAPQASVCTNTEVTFNIIDATNTNVTYEWKLPVGMGIKNTMATSATVEVGSNAASGDIEVRAVNSSGCSSPWATHAVTVNTTPEKPSVITGDAQVCLGTTNLYYVAAIPGTSTYEWVVPTGKFTSTEGTTVTGATEDVITTNTNFINLASVEASATALPVKVRGVSSTCGTGTFSDILNITLNSAPEVTITGVTDGQAFTTKDAAVSLGAILNSNGSVLTGGTFSGTGVSGNKFSPSAVSVSGGDGVTVPITYTYDNGPDCPSIARVNVVVNESSGINGIVASYCKGNTVVQNFNITRIFPQIGKFSHRYIVGLKALPNASLKTVGGNGPIMTNTPPCNTSAPATNPAQFNYSFTPGVLDPGEYQIQAYVVTVFTRGDIIIKDPFKLTSPITPIGIGTNCSVSLQTLATIKIEDIPTPVIRSTAGITVCADGTTEHTYSVVPKPGHTYRWDAGFGGRIADGVNTGDLVKIIWDQAGNNRQVKVTSTNANCSGATFLSVNVNQVPVPTIEERVDGKDKNTACAGSTVRYRGLNGDGNDYKWTVTNGSIESDDDKNIVEVKWGGQSGTLTLSTTNSDGCTGSVDLPVNIDTASDPDMQGADAVCANAQGIQYTISADPGDVVEWTITGDASHTLSPDKLTATIDWGPGPVGKIEVTKTSAVCEGSDEKIVAINALPVAEISTSSSVYCVTDPKASFQPTVNGATDISSGTGVYRLENPDGTPVPSAVFNGDDLDISSIGIGKYVVKYTFTVSAGGCQDESSGTPIEVIAKPDASFSGINAAKKYCASDNLVLTSSIAGGFFTITQLDGGGNLIASTAKDFAVGATNTTTTIPLGELEGTGLGEYHVIYTFRNSSGCEDVSDEDTFEILALPTVSVDINGIDLESCVKEDEFILFVTIDGFSRWAPLSTDDSFFEIRRVSGSRAPTDFKEMKEDNGFGGTRLSRRFNPKYPITHNETAIANDAPATEWNELAGVYEVRYVYTNFRGCQQTSAPQTFTLKKLPVVSFTGLSNFYCKAVTNVQLTPSVDGALPDVSKGTGTFRIFNAGGIEQTSFTGNEFDPSVLGLGGFTITYEYQLTGGCKGVTAAQPFTVGEAIVPTFSFVAPNPDNKYCVKGGDIALQPDAGNTGGTFTVTNPKGEEFTLDGNVIELASFSDIGSYQVRYTFTDGAGCTGTSANQTFQIVPLPVITIKNINSNGEYCVQSPVITLIPEITTGAGKLDVPDLDATKAYFQIKRKEDSDNDYVTMVTPGSPDLTNEFNPQRPLPSSPPIPPDAPTSVWNQVVGEYEVRYVFEDGNGCRKESASEIIKVTPLPQLSFTGLSASYCDDVELVTLIPFDGESRITSGVVFNYRKLSESTFTPFTQGNSFSPNKWGAGEYEIMLESAVSGCQNSSNRDSVVTIKIEPTPKQIRVVASRDYNSRTLNFSATANGVNDTWTWSWDFKDGTTSQEQNPAKQLSATLPQVINYELIPTTELGCNASVSKRFKMDFDFTGHCAGGVTRFTNKSELPGDVVGAISWDFGDGQGTSTETNPGHTYQNPGTYWVTLSIQTDDEVATYKLRRRLDIFPVIEVNSEQFYVEGFDNGTAGWISHGVVDVDRVEVDSTSWTLKNPDGFLIRNPNGNAWITDNRSNPHRINTDANYNNNEQSYVESPCFNIAGLNKPMISFSYWSDTDLGADGVTLLYTIDDGKTWHRLGTGELGINWYNTKPILGAPGKTSSTLDVNANPDSQGWSGKLLPVNGKWQVARYSLTEALIKMQAMGIKSRMVRFRMSFGSNADNLPNAKFDGFAFDNVIVSNRNRLVLLEYFINTGLPNAAEYDLTAKNFPKTGNKDEIVKIHHHTGFPGIDPLNEVNKKDPSARAFHHGIREVPRGVVDGYFKDTLIGQWTQDIFADRTLIPAPFTIDITNAATSGGQLNISTKIQALLNFDRKIIINVAVVDSAATANGQVYYNVTRKMLPDAAGTYWEAPWVQGDSQTFDFSWDYGNLDPTGFKVIVFVEDYETKEIWQAGTGGVSVKRQHEGQSEHEVTGVEDELLMGGAVLFPNPTTDRLNVAIKTQLSPKAQWQIWSVTGKLVKQGSWSQGKKRVSIDVQALAGGWYILRVADKGKTSQLRFEKH